MATIDSLASRSIAPGTAAHAAAGAGPSATSGSASAAETQDRFLQLLVAQMRNQDPLNPMDNAQMTSQIAQINTVAGLEKLNAGISALLATTTTQLQAQSAAQMPGRHVLVEGDRITEAASGNPAGVTGGVELAAAADAVRVEILDGGGRVVRTLDLGPAAQGVRTFHWDGLAEGGAATSGPWRMRVQAATAAGQAVGATALMPAGVQSAAASADGIELDLGAAGVRPASAVKAYL